MYYTFYTYYTYYVSGDCSPLDLGIPRISQAQGLCTTVWCWVIPNTRVSNGFTATHFPQNPSTAVITWTWSWSGRWVSITAPLLCRWILSGMLGFCFCSQHLLWLTLDPSPSNAAHWYRHWRHTTILRMVIISIMIIIHVKLIKVFNAL